MHTQKTSPSKAQVTFLAKTLGMTHLHRLLVGTNNNLKNKAVDRDSNLLSSDPKPAGVAYKNPSREENLAHSRNNIPNSVPSFGKAVPAKPENGFAKTPEKKEESRVESPETEFEVYSEKLVPFKKEIPEIDLKILIFPSIAFLIELFDEKDSVREDFITNVARWHYSAFGSASAQEEKEIMENCQISPFKWPHPLPQWIDQKKEVFKESLLTFIETQLPLCEAPRCLVVLSHSNLQFVSKHQSRSCRVIFFNSWKNIPVSANAKRQLWQTLVKKQVKLKNK